MKIDNYAITMNSQYYNLQQDFTQAKVSQELENFSSDESLSVEKVEMDLSERKSDDSELSVALSKAILKSVSDEENKSIRDRVELTHIYTESQALDFEVKAYIRSEDREIELSLDVSLSRSFTQKTSISLESLQVLKDPLVLSFDGSMPSLSTSKFSFDIDSDGERDQISKLSVNSTFLALDKNSNGFVDDGSELFGTKSGDGFADLAKYDEDKNGWIDENDAIFDKLQVWKKSETKDELIGLGEVGIGAIFLGNAVTPFSLKSDSNDTLGEMRSSGFFLYENGMAGVISQIDMAVSSDTKEALENFDDMQKGLAPLKIGEAYVNEDKSQDSDDTRMEKLQAKIKELESKLSTASDGERAGIQAEIGAIFAQMMALLEEEFMI